MSDLSGLTTQQLADAVFDGLVSPGKPSRTSSILRIDDAHPALRELVRRLTEAEQERDRLRGRIVLAADAFTTDDVDEAYHELYAAVDPDFASTVDPFERWREHADALEAHADE
jgi:hypothetical protein